MNKFLSIMAAVVLAATPVAASAPSVSPNVIIENGEGHGSGVYLGDGIILTAGHVAAEALKNPMTVRTDNGVKQSASVLWVSAKYDVALMHIDVTKNIGVAVLDCKPNPIGERIKMYGNPLDQEFIYTNGEVVSIAHPAGDWASVIDIDGAIIPGQSGGADYDDVTGEVVGINVGVQSFQGGLTNLGFVVPASVICMLMGKK